MIYYPLKQVSIISILHDDTKAAASNVIGAYHRLCVFGSMKASLYEMTFLCLIEARILTSLIAFSFSFSERFPRRTFFNAYTWLSAILLTLYT